MRFVLPNLSNDCSTAGLIEFISEPGGTTEFQLFLFSSSAMSLQLQPVTRVTDVDTFIQNTLLQRSELEDDSFTVVNLSEIQERFEEWQREFPDVEPFFALKAQHNANTLKLLADNGCGFDVASLGEMQSVISANVPSSRILYAQPYKQPSHLVFALERGILSVCDTVDEIRKIGQYSAKLGCTPKILIRILPDDKESDSQSSLSTKFGAPLKTLNDLMTAATEAHVTVIGISFHIGSHCHSADPYLSTLRLSRVWWNRLVSDHGARLEVLDIGGGYPGERGDDFKKMARLIRLGIEEHYGDVRSNIRIIAEPGRYMVTSSLSVVANVIAEKGAGQFVLNTGVYGGLSYSMWDRKAARGSKPYLISAAKCNGVHHSDCVGAGNEKEGGNGTEDRESGSSVVKSDEQEKMVFWGPTCDSSDRLIDGYHVPNVKRGDWIVFPDLGAYCSNIMTTFNGFPNPQMHFIYTDEHGEVIENVFSSQ